MEENELHFTQFIEDDGRQLGSNLVEHVMAHHLPIRIDIMRGDHQIFHATRPVTSTENDEWIKRKVDLVYRFGHSSYYIGQLLKSKGKWLEDVYLISESLYTHIVSGPAQEDDRQLVVHGILDTSELTWN